MNYKTEYHHSQPIKESGTKRRPGKTAASYWKYLEMSDLDNHRYPSVDEQKLRSMLFKFDAIKHLLPYSESKEVELEKDA